MNRRNLLKGFLGLIGVAVAPKIPVAAATELVGPELAIPTIENVVWTRMHIVINHATRHIETYHSVEGPGGPDDRVELPGSRKPWTPWTHDKAVCDVLEADEIQMTEIAYEGEKSLDGLLTGGLE